MGGDTGYEKLEVGHMRYMGLVVDKSCADDNAVRIDTIKRMTDRISVIEIMRFRLRELRFPRVYLDEINA